MSYKIRLPDEDIEPIWDKMSKIERKWYEDFKKAAEYYNWGALKHVALMAPGSDYGRLSTELHYESMAYDRARYEIPKKYKSTYTEWDYSWASPRPSKKASRQDDIDNSYDAPATSKNMKWAK